MIGCGNILRGDDAVGPVLVRHLVERGLPDGVRVIDGGTAGMDVAFGMRGAARVVIVDASATGAAPGTVYRVPAEELAELPPLDGLHTHNFRWDHALSFSTWLLGPQRPSDVTVFLVEAASFEPGAPLTAEVERGMRTVLELLERDHLPGVGSAWVEMTGAGYLHLPAAVAAAYFPSDVLLARRDGDRLELVPLVSATHGGLVLKQRTAAGDRSLLIHEVLEFAAVEGRFEASWDEGRGALVVDLGSASGPSSPGTEVSEDARGGDRGGPRVGPVVGLSGGAVERGDRASAGRDPRHPGARPAVGGPDQAGGRAAPAATGGPA